MFISEIPCRVALRGRYRTAVPVGKLPEAVSDKANASAKCCPGGKSGLKGQCAKSAKSSKSTVGKSATKKTVAVAKTSS